MEYKIVNLLNLGTPQTDIYKEIERAEDLENSAMGKYEDEPPF